MKELLDEVEVVRKALDEEEQSKREGVLNELKGCIEIVELYESKAGASKVETE